MKMRYNIYRKVLGLAVAALTFVACSDTWDEHYEGTISGAHEGSIWQAIKNNGNLSNFASVMEATGYDKSLASSQVFTVFAPTNDQFSAAEAKALIDEFNRQKGKVSDEDNSVVKEFVQNHIALYNYSVADTYNDTIVLMNGKYANLRNDGIGESSFLPGNVNQLYNNGLLFVIDKKIEYFPNIFEYFRMDSDLDSIRNFLYSGDLLNSDRSTPLFYKKTFLPERSVAGGIENGRTVYLDSVFRQENSLFGRLGRLSTEDSLYWMVAPSNAVWKQLVEEYAQYFNYEDNVDRLLTVGNRDSLTYSNTRLAIVNGTVFSRSYNPDEALQDSALSTAAALSYSNRRWMWGSDTLSYYQYYNPLEPGGVMYNTEDHECSNGKVMKVMDPADWNFDKSQTFCQQIVVEAEDRSSIQDMTKTLDARKDTIYSLTTENINVNSDSKYYGKVSGNTFVEFSPVVATINNTVTFNIENVLSNMGYDIYVVTAPALAADSNATDVQRLPTILRATLNYHTQDGKLKSDRVLSSVKTDDASKGYYPDSVNYVKLAENYKFPVSNYGLYEEKSQISLSIETQVTNSQQRNKLYTRTMRIDCIILKPHEE